MLESKTTIMMSETGHIATDTIAAIATAPGTSAIAIVRLSGPRALEIAQRIFIPGKTKNLSKKAEKESGKDNPHLVWRSHKAMFGLIFDINKNSAIDEVVLIPYKCPHSYTGEDLVEINCHGSPIIANEILSLCMTQGARLAKGGEFTERAFLSGRIDLTQAESVLDLIQAKTGKQSRLALSGLAGYLGEQIALIRNQLLGLMTRVVAGIDFPDEVGDAPINEIEAIVQRSLDSLNSLAETSRSGKFLREGMKIAIVGKPNAGKSSLLNQLLKFERAIVTEIPGTTRDSLEELLDINGLPVTLIDTAGIRHTNDTVEKIGIERTKKTITSADLVLFVVDLTTNWQEEDRQIAQLVKNKPHIMLANKSDLVYQDNIGGVHTQDSKPIAVLPISAKAGSGIDQLSYTIEKWATADANLVEARPSLNARQNELCQKAIKSLLLVQEALIAGLPQDCLATDLKTSIDSLSEISGEAVSEEIIRQVFANFCIGK